MCCLPRREVASQHFENVVENHHSAPVHVAAHQSDSCGDNECLVVSPASIVRDGESFCIHDTVNRQMAWGTNQKRSFIASRLILWRYRRSACRFIQSGKESELGVVCGIQRSRRCVCESDASLMKGVLTSRCNQECVLLRTFTVLIREREQ